MNKYMVMTNVGDYEVYARDAEMAKREVYRLTFGRAQYMVVRRAD